ncbi:hypothetical protein GCM10022249_09900 [Enteractinococcus coprophilus]
MMPRATGSSVIAAVASVNAHGTISHATEIAVAAGEAGMINADAVKVRESGRASHVVVMKMPNA